MNPLEFIKEIKELIFDSSASWGTVLAKFITLLVFLVVVDMSFNFTYNLQVSNKLSQLEKISTLKKDYKKDTLKLVEIKKIENGIFEKEHYSEFFSRIFSKISFPQETKIQKTHQNNTASIKTTKPIFSLFWMAFSSNYALVIILPFLFFLPVYNKEIRTANGIAGWTASLVMIGGMIAIVTWVSFQIPLVFDNPIWNYILNSLVHTFFWFLIIKFGKNKKLLPTHATTDLGI
jgi:hypothetical protein